jgi:hypothetical protein
LPQDDQPSIVIMIFFISAIAKMRAINYTAKRRKK